VPALETAFFFLGVFAFPVAAGLLSGVSHCAAMCGPIHIFLARQGGGNLWLYHDSRVVTYVCLGVLAGFLSRSIPLSGIAWAWIALYVLMGLKFIGVPLWPADWGDRYGGWILAKIRPLTREASGGKRPLYLIPLGLAAGFLPCATTQAGLAWAIGTSNPVTGGTGMLLLGAGTLPLFLAWPRKWFPKGRGWYHIALGIGMLALAAWKAHALYFTPVPTCH
jgi:sulfite exporter TauE/SafE